MRSIQNDAAVVDRMGTTCIIKMNLPDSRNSFGTEMKEALYRHLDALMNDRSCRAIILTGTGSGFSSGGNLRQLQGRTVAETRASMGAGHRLIRLMLSGPKPIIAAVEGYAHGAGVSLAAACDFIVAADNAVFSCAFLRIGLAPDTGIRWLLTQRVGPSKAKELLTLGQTFDGMEALRIGFANRIAPSGTTLDKALEVAGQYAKSAPLALALTKASFVSGGSSLDDCFRTELEDQPVLIGTHYHREAVSAFLEKRPAVFSDE